MNRNFKKALKVAFDAPKPTRKLEFLNSLPYPKATNLEFWLSQISYIRKRFWCLSALLFIGMVVLSLSFKSGKEIVSIVSATLPLLALTGITEINKSVSFQMTELEMSCKYNLGKITLIRLSTIGAVHLVILLLSLLLFKDQSQYELFRYALYTVTPFLLSSYLSFWITNHLKLKDSLYICSGVTALISSAVLLMHSNFTVIFATNYTRYWSIAFIALAILLMKELYFLLTERNEQWNFA